MGGLGIRLITGGAFFALTGHSVSDLLTFFCEKSFRDLGSGFLMTYTSKEN